MDGKKHGKRRIRYQSRNPYKRRKEEDIRKILDKVDSGISKRAACLKFGLNRKTLEGWIRRIAVRNLGESFSDKLFLSMTDNQQNMALAKKIQELSKALEAANLKIAGLETMIEVAEEEFKIRIKKKLAPNSHQNEAKLSQQKPEGACQPNWIYPRS